MNNFGGSARPAARSSLPASATTDQMFADLLAVAADSKKAKARAAEAIKARDEANGAIELWRAAEAEVRAREDALAEATKQIEEREAGVVARMADLDGREAAIRRGEAELSDKAATLAANAKAHGERVAADRAEMRKAASDIEKLRKEVSDRGVASKALQEDAERKLAEAEKLMKSAEAMRDGFKEKLRLLQSEVDN